MRIVARIVVLIVGLYILTALGLVEILMSLLIGVGKTIIQLAHISPIAAAIGVLLVIVIAGTRSISEGSHRGRGRGRRN